MCVSLSWGMGSGPGGRRASVDPAGPEPRRQRRQRLSRSVGLLPEVWNEFSGTLEPLYQTGKNRRKKFYRYIYIRRYIRDALKGVPYLAQVHGCTECSSTLSTLVHLCTLCTPFLHLITRNIRRP